MDNGGKRSALDGGQPIFSEVKPTSNLVKPDWDLLEYYTDLYLSRGHQHIVNTLEEQLAHFHNVRHCITFNSGFWALVQSIRIIANPTKSEVIIPSYTYRRLGALVAWSGKTPVFCDISKKTLALCPDSVRSQCSGKTSLIIGVHPVGSHVDIDGLMSISEEFTIPVFFDSVESVYELHRGVVLGGNGVLALYSLGASKLINGFEGGYITTNCSDIAKKMRNSLSERSSQFYLDVAIVGINAAAALAGLQNVEVNINKNKARFEAYRTGLEQVPGIRIKEQEPSQKPSYKNIIVELLDDWPMSLEETIKILNKEGILARKNCPPITDKEISYTHRRSVLNNTAWASKRFVSMPCGYMTDISDIEKIVKFLGEMAVRFSGFPSSQTL